jgi:cytoskeletal protein CcmA (bactofilin family)
MIRRFLGPQPTDKPTEKPNGATEEPGIKTGTPERSPAAGSPAGGIPAAGSPAAGSPAKPAPVASATQTLAPRRSHAPVATPRPAAGPQAGGAAPRPAINPSKPTIPNPVAKEADVSQRPESIQAVPRAVPDQSVTVIGNGARLEGNLISAASLRIEGGVTGTITADGDVIIAPEAEVSADIKSTNATLGGKFKGNAVVTGTIELTSTARVEGNLTSRSLIVNQGAIFSGQSIMDGGTKKPAASLSSAPPAAGTPAASPSAPTPGSSTPGSSTPGGGTPGGAPKPE